MAALHLVIEDYSTDPEKSKDLDQQAFPILRDFLQPDSEQSLNPTSISILTLLADEDPNGKPMLFLGELFIELAEQIPYSHPSQLKLARLLQQMSLSDKVISNLLDTRYCPFQSLWQSFRDTLSSPDPDNLSAWVNFHSFVAKVEFHVWHSLADPTWTIWAMRDAFEQDDKYYESSAVRDTYVLAAAQYVLWKGQSVIQRIVYPGNVSNMNKQQWAPGPRYSGSAYLDMSRWHYWRDGFLAAAESGTVLDEVKTVAGKTVKLMDVLEETTLGLS